jgi:pilus assembly protein CpaC
VTRLRTAVPLQVNLKVRIAEVNRSALKQIGVNLFAATQRRVPVRHGQGSAWPGGAGTTSSTRQGSSDPLGATRSRELPRLDSSARLDLLDDRWPVDDPCRAEPDALSGETASFLAGGEFPIPSARARRCGVVEYKSYGVGAAFTPVVLADGRISMRVRPEVSELSAEGALRLSGFDVPGPGHPPAETTVELGSGQSFMLAGLLKAQQHASIEQGAVPGRPADPRAPVPLAQLPPSETELVIIVTPYLVRPVTAAATPSMASRAHEGTAILEGQHYTACRDPRPAAAGPRRHAARCGAPAPLRRRAAPPAPGSSCDAAKDKDRP